MGILTKIKEEAHFAVPVFFLLLLYINNMPVDFNIKVLSPQEILPWAPKATFKNVLMAISFTIFMVFFETGLGYWKYKYGVFVLIFVLSWVFYAIYKWVTGSEHIKNGEVKGILGGYVNDIKVDDWVTAGINSGVATLMIICIFGLFLGLKKLDIDNQNITLIISIPVIFCLSILYLKADGVLGLINGYKDKVSNIAKESLKEPWSFWLYWGFIAFLLCWTFFGPGAWSEKTFGTTIYSDRASELSTVMPENRTSEKRYYITKYINPYGTLGRDTNHPALAVFILLIMAYMSRNKKMGFVIFTILIIVWEILYDKVEPVKNHMKTSLLSFFILFLCIDASISSSSNMINDEGEKVKKESQ